MEAASQGTSVCSALHSLQAPPPPLHPVLSHIGAFVEELLRILKAGSRAQVHGVASSLNVREALTVVIVSNLVFYVSILCR